MKFKFVLPVILSLSGCMANPNYYGASPYASIGISSPRYAAPMQLPINVPIMNPIGVAPGPGWGWAYHPNNGWGWHHHEHGWRHDRDD